MKFPAYQEMLFLARRSIKVYPKRYLLASGLSMLAANKKAENAKYELNIAWMCARDFLHTNWREEGLTVEKLEAELTKKLADAATAAILGREHALSLWVEAREKAAEIRGYRMAVDELTNEEEA